MINKFLKLMQKAEEATTRKKAKKVLKKVTKLARQDSTNGKLNN